MANKFLTYTLVNEELIARIQCMRYVTMYVAARRTVGTLNRS